MAFTFGSRPKVRDHGFFDNDPREGPLSTVSAVEEALRKGGVTFLSNDTMGEGVRFTKPRS